MFENQAKKQHMTFRQLIQTLKNNASMLWPQSYDLKALASSKNGLWHLGNGL